MAVRIDRKILLDAALAGYDTPAVAAEYLFPPSEGSVVDPEVVAAIEKVLNSTEFNTEFQRAKDDLVGSAISSIRRTVMENILEVKDLARTATDPRVRLAANKDLLDRAGLAPAQRTVAYTPSDYFKLIEGLQTKDEPKEAGTEDQPTGVVPEAGISAPEGASGS